MGSVSGFAVAAVAAVAESVADVAGSSLVSGDSVGTGRGVARTVRGTACFRSTDRLSTSTTSGALLGSVGGSLTGLTVELGVAAADRESAGTAWVLGRCLKLRTNEAPAADAVMQTTSAMHAETQRGRSAKVSAI